MSKQNYQKAEDCYKKALAVAEIVGNLGLVFCWISLSNLYERKGEYENGAKLRIPAMVDSDSGRRWTLIPAERGHFKPGAENLLG